MFPTGLYVVSRYVVSMAVIMTSFYSHIEFSKLIHVVVLITFMDLVSFVTSFSVRY